MTRPYTEADRAPEMVSVARSFLAGLRSQASLMTGLLEAALGEIVEVQLPDDAALGAAPRPTEATEDTEPTWPICPACWERHEPRTCISHKLWPAPRPTEARDLPRTRIGEELMVAARVVSRALDTALDANNDALRARADAKGRAEQAEAALASVTRERNALREAVEAWDAKLSDWCDCPERNAVRAAVAGTPTT